MLYSVCIDTGPNWKKWGMVSLLYPIFSSQVYAVCPYANLLGTSSMYQSLTGAVSGLLPSSWGAFGLGDNSEGKNTLV